MRLYNNVLWICRSNGPHFHIKAGVGIFAFRRIFGEGQIVRICTIKGQFWGLVSKLSQIVNIVFWVGLVTLVNKDWKGAKKNITSQCATGKAGVGSFSHEVIFFLSFL